MDTLPKNISNLLVNFSCAFTQPTFGRFCLLLLASIITTGARTVSNLLRTVDFFVDGHFSDYHRMFSMRRFSTWKLSRALIDFILKHYYSDEKIIIEIVGDDTVDEHPGRKVFGKAKHRDAVRSSHTFTAFKWGHKWVVLSILVRFPFSRRPWALPVLIALYTPPDISKKMNRHHRTPSEILQALTSVLIRWFPERKFRLAIDSGCVSHYFAQFAHQHKTQLILISKFHPQANLYSAPQSLRGVGRPRVKGEKLKNPEQVVKQTPLKDRKKMTVAWYGGETRKIEVIEGTGFWYKGGDGIIPVKWVFVHDLTGTHRDEYFFSTDSDMTSKQIIETYTGRWSIEVTFEEVRAYVGFGTTRGRVKNTIMREAPCLFGLFSVVALIFDQLPKKYKHTFIMWNGKHEMTFSDAITAVRRFLWVEWIFETLHFKRTFQKFPQKLQLMLLYSLAPAR